MVRVLTLKVENRGFDTGRVKP